MRKGAQVKIAPEILKGIDLSNSLNGGSSEISNWLEQAENGYEFFVRVPGVEVEKLSVEVVQNRVLVYYMFPLYQQGGDDEQLHARVVGNFSIPADGDYERVSASYEDSEKCLRIEVPFNEQQKGYRSKVEIER